MGEPGKPFNPKRSTLIFALLFSKKFGELGVKLGGIVEASNHCAIGCDEEFRGDVGDVVDVVLVNHLTVFAFEFTEDVMEGFYTVLDDGFTPAFLVLVVGGDAEDFKSAVMILVVNLFDVWK